MEDALYYEALNFLELLVYPGTDFLFSPFSRFLPPTFTVTTPLVLVLVVLSLDILSASQWVASGLS
jgi:hypothetical protein